MTKAIITLRLATGEEAQKEVLFERKKDALQLKKTLEKGALMKKSICSCSVELVAVNPI